MTTENITNAEVSDAVDDTGATPKRPRGRPRKNAADKVGKGKSKRAKKSVGPASPVRNLRSCALPGCGEAFYPERDWQKFCTPKCATKDRQRRLRERYRKLLKLNSGDITEGVGGRKSVTRHSSREITRAEAGVIERIRKLGAPAMEAVRAVLEEPATILAAMGAAETGGVGNTSPALRPVPASHSPPGAVGGAVAGRVSRVSRAGRAIGPTHRMRNMRRVHPRSLQQDS
jgi:hypothetical protein